MPAGVCSGPEAFDSQGNVKTGELSAAGLRNQIENETRSNWNLGSEFRPKALPRLPSAAGYVALRDMQTLHQLRDRARGLLWPGLCLLAAAYFGYHALQGDRGLIAYAQTAMEIKRMEAELAELRVERQRMEAQAALLHPDHVDPDMLDEQVRRALGLAHPDELIVFTN